MGGQGEIRVDGTSKPPINTSFYTGAQVGLMGMGETTGLIFGAEVSKNGTFARTQLGAGTSFTGKLEFGHEFDIGKNMGLELSANARVARSNIHSNVDVYSLTANQVIPEQIAGEGLNVSTVTNTELTSEYHPAEIRSGAKVQFSYKPKTKKVDLKLGLGLEGGVVHEFAPKASGQIVGEVNVESQNQKYAVHTVSGTVSSPKTRGYLSPTLTVDLGFGKNRKWSLNTKVGTQETSLGVRYNFK